MDNLFLIQEILTTKHLLYFTYTKKKIKYFRTSIEECNQEVLKKILALTKNTTTNKTQKNKGGKKQHHLIRIFMHRQLPLQTS